MRNVSFYEEKFMKRFNHKPEHYLRCGGRFEVLGNHTDHNHGLCIAATCDMSIYSAVSKRKDNKVICYSAGYPVLKIDLSTLDKKEIEIGKSHGIIRGVASYLVSHGYKVGGFNCFMKSTIFKGAGVSSSAAYEMLIGKIFSVLFNEDKIEKILLAKAGQFAENKYYGKSCGLLDQVGVSWGGMVAIDFNDMNDVKVNSLSIDLKDNIFYLVNTGGDHSSMSDLYSQIPVDMKSAAKKLGVNYLRETTFECLENNKDKLTEIEYSRAKHFFKENERVAKLLKNKDVETLKECINGTRLSCTYDLKNMMAYEYNGSPLEACDLVMKVTNNQGACKINGGGFAGSIVCLIPTKYEEVFLKEMKEKYGDKNVYKANIDYKGLGNF